MNIGDKVQLRYKPKCIGIITNITPHVEAPHSEDYKVIRIYVTHDKCNNKQRKPFIREEIKIRVDLLQENNNPDWTEEVQKILENS